MQVTLNDLSGNDKHYNNLTELPLDAMIADKANWTDFSWAHYTPKPEFGDGTVSIASTTETKWALAGYKKQKFRNTEFQFKYRQTAAEMTARLPTTASSAGALTAASPTFHGTRPAA